MRNNSLLYFRSPLDFEEFILELDIYNGWKIKEGLLNARGKLIEDRYYTNFLRKTFNEKGFFRKQVSIAEIVSWLDTISLMKRYIEFLKTKLSAEEFMKMTIYVEYVIELSKKMRVDYILEVENKLLLIEFRTVSTFEKIRPTWDIKYRELIIYKELMSYYIRDHQLYLYSFVAMFEYNAKGLIEKQKQYNDNQIAYMSEFTIKYLFHKK